MRKALAVLLVVSMMCMTSCSKKWAGVDDLGEFYNDFPERTQEILVVMDADIAEATLYDMILNADVSADRYMNLVYDSNGDALTYEDLTSDIRVNTADMHHVSIVNSCTIIYLHFPSVGITEDMFDYYYCLDRDCYADVFDYWNDGCGILYTPDSGVMIFNGEDVISVAGDAEDGNVDEVLNELGYQDTVTLQDLFSRMNRG